MSLSVFHLVLVILIVKCTFTSTTMEPQQKDHIPAPGTHAKQGDFPSLVSLQRNDYSHFCGGNIIDESHIVTVAHCMLTKNTIRSVKEFLIMAGDVSVTHKQPGPHRVYRRPKLVFIHPQYNPKTHRNDIAVIRLARPIKKVDKVTYPLPVDSSVPYRGTACWVAGWGTPQPSLSLTVNSLRKVNVNIIDWKRCKLAYQNHISEGAMFCAGSIEGGRDACRGDSGGGLYCNNSLTGLVSFGISCGQALFPGVYVNVSAYRGFISNCTRFHGTQKDIAPQPRTFTSGSSNGGAKANVLGVILLCFLICTK